MLWRLCVQLTKSEKVMVWLTVLVGVASLRPVKLVRLIEGRP